MRFINFLHLNIGNSFALSYPHFYKGDPSLMYNIEGLNPDENLHSTKIFLNLVSIYSSLKIIQVLNLPGIGTYEPNFPNPNKVGTIDSVIVST